MIMSLFLRIFVEILDFGVVENPIILARSTDYRSNFFRHSKLRKSVETAEKGELSVFR